MTDLFEHAAEEELDFRLTIGFSPGDVPKALRRGIGYDIAFIDGLHSNEQIVEDFYALEPHLKARSVVILHDVGAFDLHSGVTTFPHEWKRHVVRGRFYKNLLGTVLLHRGFSQDVFSVL